LLSILLEFLKAFLLVLSHIEEVGIIDSTIKLEVNAISLNKSKFYIELFEFLSHSTSRTAVDEHENTKFDPVILHRNINNCSNKF